MVMAQQPFHGMTPYMNPLTPTHYAPPLMPNAHIGYQHNTQYGAHNQQHFNNASVINTLPPAPNIPLHQPHQPAMLPTPTQHLAIMPPPTGAQTTQFLNTLTDVANTPDQGNEDNKKKVSFQLMNSTEETKYNEIE